MKEYMQKPESVSRTPDVSSHSFEQPPWEVILQQYAPEQRVGEEGGNQGKNGLDSDRGVMQRAVENAKLDKTSAHAVAVQKFFDSFNQKATDAFQYVLSVPSLGGLAGLNGYTRLWVRLWTDFLQGRPSQLMKAAFGYVIETLVCNPLSGFMPIPPSGYNFLMQLPVGGTRPDVVLVHGTTQITWLDLTASGSADHIFSKEGWDKKIPMYAEITYPSVSPSDVELMRKNKGNTGSITPEEFWKKVEAERIIYKRNKEYWVNLGKTQFSRTNYKEEIKHPSWWSEEQFRTFIKSKLELYFKIVDIDLKMIPNILIAMKVDPGTWKYTTGYSQSEGAGEAWLTDHAPAPVDTGHAPASVGTAGMDIELK